MKPSLLTSFPLRMWLVAAMTATCALVTAADTGNLVSQIAVSRPSHGVNRATSSVDEHLNIDRKESLHFDVALARNIGVAQIEAPNGGRINHATGPAKIDLAKSKGQLSIDFDAGDNAGRYTIEIVCGAKSQTIEMWAGPLPPQGKPGPSLNFQGRP
jgi:hypothetical protein